MNPPTPHSLAQIAVQVRGGGAFSYLLGDFLDAFYRVPREAALAEEPLLLTGLHEKGSVYDAFLASTAQALAARQGWQPPAWAFGKTRYLHRPFFSVPAASLRATLLLESPPAFRARNLFVSANALSRA